MKIISLLKANFSQDMNIFNVSSRQKNGIFSKYILPIILFVIVCIAVGFYAYMLTDELASSNNTHVMLSIFIMVVTITTFVEGIYKSQEILFDAKDNNLLLSLPIKRQHILSIRILKLLVFQYMFNLMFLLPSFVVYGYYETPNMIFYIISILMTFLVPIIPTVFACIIGYIIKLISSKFRAKKLIQTCLSILAFAFFFFIGTKIGNVILSLGNKAEEINNVIEKIYLPIKLYINLIMDFEILDLLKLLLINLLPLGVFKFIAEKWYFKIITKSQEKGSTIKTGALKKEVIKKSQIVSLLMKELKRYFASPVYVFNTAFGPLVLLVITIFLRINNGGVFKSIFYMSGLDIAIIYYLILLIVGAVTQISASSISLEGKTINITKSLPVEEYVILKSKILAATIIETPLLILSSLVFISTYETNLLYAILLLGQSLVMPIFIACIGLIVNLKYPKMDANNDTEVVKQSMGSMVSTLIGIVFFVGSLVFIIYLNKLLIIQIVLMAHFILLIFATKYIYDVLMKYGPGMYKDINV